MKDIGVPETQDAKPIGSQEIVSPGVVRRVLGVLAAVEFDNDSGFEADEIADVATDWTLSAELEAV